jgi:hypothetical protein
VVQVGLAWAKSTQQGWPPVVLLRVTELAPSSAAQQRARVLVLGAVPPAGELLVSAPVAVQVAQLVSPSRLALPSSVAVVARLAVCGQLVS